MRNDSQGISHRIFFPGEESGRLATDRPTLFEAEINAARPAIALADTRNPTKTSFNLFKRRNFLLRTGGKAQENQKALQLYRIEAFLNERSKFKKPAKSINQSIDYSINQSISCSWLQL
jgi:hypothetical protein